MEMVWHVGTETNQEQIFTGALYHTYSPPPGSTLPHLQSSSRQHSTTPTVLHQVALYTTPTFLLQVALYHTYSPTVLHQAALYHTYIHPPPGIAHPIRIWLFKTFGFEFRSEFTFGSNFLNHQTPDFYPTQNLVGNRELN